MSDKYIMKKLNSASLGAWMFFASSHSADSCGLNGLPLTPNSIRILGRFQKLKTFVHPNLCLYLDIIRKKHERIIIISEHYTRRLRSEDLHFLTEDLPRITFEFVDTLGYLHSKGIVHRMLSPDCILFNNQGQLKLANYGLFDITEYGACVPFCIGVPKYMAPEVLLLSCLNQDTSTRSSPTGPKCDIWSLGLILLEKVLGIELWKGFSLEDTFKTILSLKKYGNGKEIVTFIATQHSAEDKLQDLSSLVLFIENCLTYIPSERHSANQLLSSEYLTKHGFSEEKRAKAEDITFPSIELRCQHLVVPKYVASISDHLSQCPLDIVYYLWQLAGGDIETELRRQGLIKPKPPIFTLPNLVLQEGEEFGQKKDRAFLMNSLVILLPLDQLRQRLKNLDPRIYYPLLENSSVVESNSWVNPIEETGSLPLVIREKDIEYQLHRTIIYNRLLAGYPYKRSHIVREARKDIPPLYRAKIWAALLEVEGDVQQQYDSIDKETATPTDRQIEVDIPRCHQYNELLASPTGHLKFKRLLKAWVVSHPNYVYWQGLDSLCAPFLHLNFNDEALAFACLKAFIPKYLHNFFLKDNSPIIQEYLAVFSHLIAYHDPQLTNHLDSIGFIPELYSIPWFLTMYTHVFPLHKIFHLWDTLLLGSSSFPLCIGVAILQQLRSNLLSFGFNECILLFSDMPEIDIERCVRDSIKIFCSTPKTATFRQHSFGAEMDENNSLGMSPLPLEILKSELTSRITAEELLELLDPKSSTKVKLLVVDVRPNDEFSKGAIAEGINIPFPSAFSSDGSLSASPETSTLSAHKGKMVVVIGSNKNSHSSHFANQLVRLGYARVCTLHRGIEVLRGVTGTLVVRTAV